MNDVSKFSVSWSAYGGDIGKSIEKHRNLFNVADDFLRYLAAIYGLSIRVPEIKVFEGDMFEACAAETHDIHLSSGVVKYALQVYDEMFSGELPHGIEKPNSGHLTLNVLLFVVAHEFFHIARGHFQVIRHHPGCLHALECDADGMAATALFRYLQYRISVASISDEEQKELSEILPSDRKYLSLYSVFWPIRAQIGSSIAAPDWSPTHPCWHVRLWGVVRKMAYVDNVKVVNGVPIEDKKKISADIDVGMELLFALDEFYMMRKALPRDQSALEKFFQRDFQTEFFVPIHEKWNEIKQTVRRYSYLENLKNGAI